MELNYPAEPIDRYEIKMYRIDGERVSEIRYVYHVHTTWKALYPLDRGGVDFVDHWQVFDNDRFTGRTNDGWDVLRWRNYDDCFATYSEAAIELASRLKHTVRHFRERILQLNEKIDDLNKRIDTYRQQSETKERVELPNSCYSMVCHETTDDILVIRDECGPTHITVTNNAERVVADLVRNGYLYEGRKLNYYDTDGNLDQILVEKGKFAGFAEAAKPCNKS